MRKHKLAFLSILLLISLLLHPAAGASANGAGNPLLTCRVFNTQVNVGDKTTLQIEVQNINNLYAYQLDLHYQKAQVALLDGDGKRNGVNFLLGDFLSPSFIVLNSVDQQAGFASIALTQVNPDPARSGSGWLAKIDVQAVEAGSVSFMFNNVILAGSSGEALSHDMTGCNLEVLPAGQPTAATAPTQTQEIASPAQPTFTLAPTAEAPAVSQPVGTDFPAPTMQPAQPNSAPPVYTPTANAQAAPMPEQAEVTQVPAQAASAPEQILSETPNIAPESSSRDNRPDKSSSSNHSNVAKLPNQSAISVTIAALVILSILVFLRVWNRR